MIIKPMIRSNMCVNAHPKGCAADVKHQIEYVEKKFEERGIANNIPKEAPKTVLVLGCSTGYGLASRITAAFGYKATTIGVSFEKEGSDGGVGESREKTGTPGWYNNMAFDKFAKEAGLESVTFNGDAFSHEMRKNVIDTLKKMGKKIDLFAGGHDMAPNFLLADGTLYARYIEQRYSNPWTPRISMVIQDPEKLDLDNAERLANAFSQYPVLLKAAVKDCISKNSELFQNTVCPL